MSWFFSSRKNTSGWLLVQVGSGSATLTLVCPGDNDPSSQQILWSHKEHTLLRADTSPERNLQAILTAIFNAVLVFNTFRGRGETQAAKIDVKKIVVTVAAPWVYSVIKSAHYREAVPFEITADILNDISEAANQKAVDVVHKHELLQVSDLSIITTKTLATYGNGYKINAKQSGRVHNVEMIHLTSLVQKKLLTNLRDTFEQIFPNAKLVIRPLILTFYDAVNEGNLLGTEYTLIAITSEATEVGVVHDAVLQNITNIPSGTRTLLRGVAEILKIPTEEAALYMRDFRNQTQKLSVSRTSKLEALAESYQAELANALKSDLATPMISGKVVVYIDPVFSDYFNQLLITTLKNLQLPNVAITKAWSICQTNQLCAAQLLVCVSLQAIKNESVSDD